MRGKIYPVSRCEKLQSNLVRDTETEIGKKKNEAIYAISLTLILMLLK